MKTHSFIKLFFITVFFFLTTHGKSQSKHQHLKNVNVAVNNSAQQVNVDFNPAGQIENLLVVVSSPDGQTVFLENKYRYQGVYHATINTTGFIHGEYKMKIVADLEITEKTFTVQ